MQFFAKTQAISSYSNKYPTVSMPSFCTS